MSGPRLLVVGVLAAAFGLRVYGLGVQSLWSDEGASAAMTWRTPAEILAASAGDIHPPLYYLLLRLWTEGSGRTEFGLRFLSVLAGVLTVALTARLGGRLFGTPGRLIGALLLAVSPLGVYYSQEARMYALLGMFGALGMNGLWELTASGWGRRAAAAYVVGMAGTLYTQYFGVLLLAAANLWFGLSLLGRLRKPGAARLALGWVGLQCLVGAAALPWYLAVLPQLGRWATGVPARPLAETARDLAAQAVAGPAWTALGPWVGLAGLGLAVLGVGAFRLNPWAAGFAAVYGAVDLVMPLLDLYRPFYQPKFLLLGLPGLSLWVTAGLAPAFGVGLKPGRWLAALGAGALGGVISLELAGVGAYFVNPAYWRDDYRGLVRVISALGRPADGIILDAPGQQEIFSYYYGGPLPVYPLPRARPPDPAATVQELADLLGRHERLWVVFWGDREADPQGIVEGTLNGSGYRAWDRWFGAVRLVLYLSPRPASELTPADIQFGDALRLTGFAVGDRPEYAPGDIIPVRLRWVAERPVERPYKVFAHLVDDQEFIWGQRDSEPAGGSRPFTAFEPGRPVTDTLGIPVLPGTPPGVYRVQLGIYDPATGRRLPVTDPAGDRVVLGSLRVGVGPVLDIAAYEMSARIGRELGGLTVAGYDLRPQGASQPGSTFRPKDFLHLTVFWQRPGVPTMLSAAGFRVELVDRAGNVVAAAEARPGGPDYPPGLWRPGEIIRTQHRFFLDLPPGEYRVRLSAGAEAEPLAAFKIEG